MKAWLDGFPTRIKVEVLLGAAILVMSAVLATTPPVDEASGVAIEPVPDAFGEVAPGMDDGDRPGPAGSQPVVVNTPEAMVAIDRMELGARRPRQGHVDQRPARPRGDGGDGRRCRGWSTRPQVTPNPDGTIDWTAGAIVLPADSNWDASVRILTNDGTELQRQRFSFALDDAGISEGQVDPLLTWGLVIGLALVRRRRGRPRPRASAASSCLGARISRRGSR